jgi:hypothetical protein
MVEGGKRPISGRRKVILISGGAAGAVFASVNAASTFLFVVCFPTIFLLLYVDWVLQRDEKLGA